MKFSVKAIEPSGEERAIGNEMNETQVKENNNSNNNKRLMIAYYHVKKERKRDSLISHNERRFSLCRYVQCNAYIRNRYVYVSYVDNTQVIRMYKIRVMDKFNNTQQGPPGAAQQQRARGDISLLQGVVSFRRKSHFRSMKRRKHANDRTKRFLSRFSSFF